MSRRGAHAAPSNLGDLPRLIARTAGHWLAPLMLGLAVGLSTVWPLITLVLIGCVVGLLFLGIPRNDPIVVVAFASLCMTRLAVPGLPLPANEVLMLGSVLIAAVHPRGDLNAAPRWFAAGLWSLVALFGMSMLLNGIVDADSLKRVAHLVVFAFVALGLVQGRLPRRSALTGIVIGLTASAATGFVSQVTGIGAQRYTGRLTGLFGDPNVAGLLLATLGPLAVQHVEGRTRRRALALLLLVAVAMTLSRTALLALAVSAIWLVVGRRLRIGGAVTLLVGVIVVVGVLPTSLQSVGPFSDRVGSDQLRGRIVASEMAAVGEKPVLGHGPGTAHIKVNADQVRFFFHNSYLALAQEGGYVSLAVYLALLVATFLSLVNAPMGERSTQIEMAVIALAVCALNLGEVLLELDAAVVLGLAVQHIVSSRMATRRGQMPLVRAQ